MDFELSDEQRAFVELADDFARNELEPHAADWDRDHHFPVEVLQKAGGLGFCGLYTPESAGGLGLSRLDASLIFERLSMGCTSTTAFLTIHNMVTWMVASFGAQGCWDRWSEGLISGRLLGSYCLTEANAGSDAAALKTVARRVGDHYELTGSKMFISGAGSTQVLVVMARTGGEGAGGVSAFALDADSPGISYGRPEDKMGWNSQPTRTVTLEGVKVPAGQLLGQEGEGFKIAMKGLDGGRINIASCSLGTAQQALNQARQYLQERCQFGRKLAEFQALQFTIADMATELVAARQLVRLAACKLDAGHPDATTYCAMAKRFATDVGFRVCDQALQLYGGYGYIREYPLERYLRDTRVHRILEGTNEIMKLLIARRVLAEGSGEL